MKKKSILLCDDDTSMRSYLRALLEKQGYVVRTASRGDRMIAMATEERTDLILVDLLMPDISGWEAVAALRSQSETRRIPIVVVSILSPRENETAARSVEGWVEKPIDEAGFLSVVARVLDSPPPEPPRILLVEDDDTTAAILRAMLERHGINFHRARNGVQAIEIATWLRPHLVVLDVLLPDMDGYAVVKWLRKHEQLRDVPLIVYSGMNINADERSRLVLGPTEFVTKGLLPIRAVEQKALTILADVLRANAPAVPSPTVN